MTRRGRVRVAGAGALVAVAAAAGVVAGVSGGDDGSAASTPERHAGTTARVERRDLVETESVDGTLGYGDVRDAANRLSGTLTWLPVAGQVIRPGQTLWKVDAEPVLLMDGRVPAYRAMRSGDEGADVHQLERNLETLGYAPGTVDGTYDASTAAAVRRWQEDHDLQETGVVEAGRVVFLPGTRRVSAVSAAVGDGAASGGGDDDANRPASYDGGLTLTPAVWGAEIPDYAGDDATEEHDGDDDRGDEDDRAPADGARAGGPTGAETTPAADGHDGGDGGAQPVTILETTSTRRVVRIDLDASKQQVARAGDRAPVLLPDGTEVQGRIASVGRVAQAAEDEDPGAAATIRVTVRLTSRKGLGRLDEAPVSVELTTSRERDVLAVPVTALVATGGGGYAVQAVQAAGATRLVRVTPGLFAGGMVAVTGRGVREGMVVTIPETT